MKLYELSTAYQQIQAMIEDGQEGLEDTLESLEDAIEDKAVGYAKVMKNLEAQTKAIKDEEKRLADRRKSLENNIKTMKERLQQEMYATGIKRIKTDLFNFNIQKNPPSLEILDYGNIPGDFFEYQEPKLSRRELLKAMREGLEIEGVNIVQSESLRIR